MVKSLYEKLNEIRKEMIWEMICKKDLEKRLERLKKVCNNENILNDALEIAKHQSTVNLPGASLITAITAIMLNFITDVKTRYGILIVWIIFIWIMTTLEFPIWTKIYFDLIELRREGKGENDILKLDIIISKVDTINTSINGFEKNVNTKLEAIEQEIKSLKKK
jgi:hypothetical protein